MKKILMIIFALLGLCAIGASVTTTEIGNLHDYHNVVTNVDLSGLATSEEVQAVKTNAIVKNADNVVDVGFSITRPFEYGDDVSLDFGLNDPSGPSIVMNKLYSTAPSSYFENRIVFIPTPNNDESLLSRIMEYSPAGKNASNEVVSIVSSAVDPVRETVDRVKETAEDAQARSRVADEKSETARTLAFDAQNNANNASKVAYEAQSTANTANTNATEAKTLATTANDNVTQVLQILEGDDFRITVTNYDSTVNVPMASFDAKYTDGSTSIWKTVWVETNRHEMTKREVLNVVSNKFTSKEEAKKFRKWGNYDSVTGQDAPEGFAQCSNEGGLIFGNGAGYKSYATGSGSSYWIWQQNSGLARIETNGVFRILDADGKEAFSVTKGDKKILGADASGFYCGKLEFQATWIEIHYSVDSATHPTIEYSDTLENGGVWYKEGDSDFPLTILWTRNDTLNYWSAYLTDPRDNVQGFFRATYEAGADTVVSVGSTPMAIEYIYLGGKKYKLGTATINSNTVLTLTEVQ